MRVVGPAILCAALAAAAARASRFHVRVSNGVSTGVPQHAEIDFRDLDLADGDDGDEDEDEDASEESAVAAAASSNATATMSPAKGAGSNSTAVATSSNSTTITSTSTNKPSSSAMPTAKKTAGRQKCSVMSKYNWVDFTHVCAYLQATGFNIFYRRNDNASFVYECECEQGIELSNGVFSATKWTWTRVANTVECFSRRGKEVKNVERLFDSVSCVGTEKKFCDTKTNCTRW